MWPFKKKKKEDNKQYNKSIDIILYNIITDSYGFTEVEIATLENKYGIKIPKILREYYLKYAKHKINYANNYILEPENILTLYHLLEMTYEEDPEDFVDTHDKSLEEMKAAGNYLIFYSENQAVWQAGIDMNDLSEEDPKIYYDNPDIDNWSFMSNSVSSFLLSMLWENLKGSFLQYEHYRNDTKKIRDAALSNNIDLGRLIETDIESRFCRTCFDNDAQKLYFFLINDSSELVELIIVNYSVLKNNTTSV